MKRILIVDDDWVGRSFISRIIAGIEGLSITMAISGKDGWREFQESRPDLIITDSWMEVPNAGIILAKQIKKVSPTTPVIMVTEDKEIKKSDFVDYLFLKSFNEKDLKALIEEVKKYLGNS